MTTVYNCEKCLKNFNRKSTYDNHMKRKTPCNTKNLTCDICLKLFTKKSTYDNHMKKKIPCKTLYEIKNKFTCDICLKIFAKKSTYNNHMKRKTPCKIKNNEFKCDVCNKQYATNSNLFRHKKNSCNNNNIILSLDKKIDTLLENKTTNIINNITNITNNTNNIQINAYNVLNNSEFLQMSDFKKIFEKYMLCVQEYIKYVHCNPDKPEYNNIYISNLSNGYIQIHDGTKWNIENKKIVINELFDDVCFILETASDEYKEHYNTDLIRKINKFININNNTNSKKYISYKNFTIKDITRVLYNNKPNIKK